MNNGCVVTNTMVERMKRAAKAIRREQGVQHCAALELVARDHGFESWHAVTIAAAAAARDVDHPPVGTPAPSPHGGNSTPAAAPVAGLRKSPAIGPVRGE